MKHAFRLPGDRLPTNRDARDAVLGDYFAERVASSMRDGEEWVVDVSTAPALDFYADARLQEGLEWWGDGLHVENVPLVWRDMDRWQLSLNDSWTLYAWSRFFARAGSVPDVLVILHVDDHDDLMTPRLSTGEGSFVDLLTDAPMNLLEPASVASAVMSGAVAQGSFLAPAVHAAHRVEIRHLCQTRYARERPGAWALAPTVVDDAVLAPGSPRPSVTISRSDLSSGSRYLVTDDVDEWVADVPDGVVLLHVDFDYFNNRFNGDSDWLLTSDRHDPPIEVVLAELDRMLASLGRLDRPISATAAALSPGFFPVEMWQPAVEAFDAGYRRLAAS